jgi:iron complex outermembrane recepter protein
MQSSKALAHACSRALILLAASGPVFSQDPGAPAASAAADRAEASVLEEITVTAQRRAENAQKVPISIVAISGESLQQNNVGNAVELAKEVPNVEMKSVYSSAKPTIFMRGIGIDDYQPATSGAVGITVDDVFLDSGLGLLFQTYDIDRVEVMKGPQGTLFGRNTTGGVIAFNTHAPTFQFDPFIQVNYGRFDEVDVEAASSFPIVADKLAGRVSFSSRERDGWRRDLSTGRRVNNEDNMAVRGQLLFTPSAQLDILAKYEHGRSRGSAQAYESWGLLDPVSGALCSEAQIRARGACANLSGYVDSKDAFTSDVTPDRMQEDLQTDGGRLGVTYRGDSLTFSSISAWSSARYAAPLDVDASPARLLEITLEEARAEQWTQELRLASADDTPFQWIAGAYYMNSKVRLKQAFEVYGGLNPTPGVPYFDPVGATTGGFPVLTAVPAYQQETDSYAAFIHTTYQLSERFKATVGARYTWEDKGIVFQSGYAPVAVDYERAIPPAACCLIGDPGSIDPATGLPTVPLHDVQHFAKPQWRLALDYDMGEAMLYGAYARGVRSGTYNVGATFENSEFNKIGPEKIDNFELGLKADLTPSLRLNAAAFYYTGQLQVFTLKAVEVVDSADVRGYGVEASLLAQPLDGLTVGLSVGGLHAEYTDFPDAPANNGNRLVSAPKFSSSASVDYDIPISAQWEFSAGINANYRSRNYFNVENDSLLSQAGYALTNARIAFRRSGESSKFEVALWGQNIFDETYLTQVLDIAAYTGSDLAVYGLPRTYGISVRYEQ